ncbi:Rieske 2Fe-2S domain-containing protein [Salinisphaera hydrothermalis]
MAKQADYAFGWFQVCYSNELGVRHVRPFHAFGREFVLWRDEERQPHLMQAYCHHLGAHLGHGGTVCDGVLHCPFHGWQYDGNGQCVAIPYSPDAKLNGRHIEALPIKERNGTICAWYHPCGEPPSFDVPVLEEWRASGWSRYRRQYWEVDTEWREIQENIVDSTHFHYLHGVNSLADVRRCEPVGHILNVDIHHQFRTPHGVRPGFIQTTLYGPYLAIVRFRIADLAEMVFIDAVTPIDPGNVAVTFSLTARLTDIQDPDMSLELVEEGVRQVSEDVPIWSHKTRWDRPSLARGDGPIMKFRRWADQFYIKDHTSRPADTHATA